MNARRWMRAAAVVFAVAALPLSQLVLTPVAAADPSQPTLSSLPYGQQYGGSSSQPSKGAQKSTDGGKWGKATKDAEIHDGLFRIYKGKNTWHMQINPDQFDQQYMLSLTIAQGIGSKFLLGGLTLNDDIIRFVRDGEQVFLLKEDLRFRAPGDADLERAVELSFAPSTVAVFKVEAEREDSVLIDLKEFLTSDYPDIAENWESAFGGKPRIDSKLSSLGTLMVFPENVEMDAKLTLTPANREKAQVRTTADDRYVPVTIRYSWMKLPEPGFTPRLADDRVGYFLTAHKDFTRDDNESYKVHFINRWRLERKNPSARLSEPVEPIVFYLENTIPEKWRPYIREGVEAWNAAFEEAGFKNAIVAKDQPEDDPEWDAADVRYATIRWISSSEPSFGAIGPSRVDPRTGEIFDADILIEASWILGFKNSYRRYVGPETVAEALDGIHPEMRNAPFQHQLCQAGMIAFDSGNIIGLSRMIDGSMPPGSPVPDEFIGQSLVELTLHEVGHTIGLRHNFQSSVSVPNERLGDYDFVMQNGLTGSVMDYPTPYIDGHQRKDHIYFTQSVGPWDRWVVRYGYTPSTAESPWDEESFLADIAEECTRPGHQYGTDEDTYPIFALDPRNNIFDLGDDPLQFGVQRANYLQTLWGTPNFEQRVLARGTGYQTLRYSVNTLIFQYGRALSHGLKYIGGQTVSRAHYGDPDARDPFTPVPADEQRAALAFLTDKALSPNSYDVNPALLNKLIANRTWDWEANLFQSGPIDYPLYATILAYQTGILDRLLEPHRIARIREAETRQNNPLTLAEYFNELTGAVWGEFGVGSTNAEARQNPSETLQATSGPGTRRDLQRAYVDDLIFWVVNEAPPGTDDGRALARLHLTRIDQACARRLNAGGTMNDALRAHLLETRERIDRALDADMEVKG